LQFVSDILLGAGALGAGLYCLVLARRLNRFNDLEKGVGGAVAVLSAQVDDLTKTLVAAQATAEGSGAKLAEMTVRAEDVAKKLELMMASMHDISESPPGRQGSTPTGVESAPAQTAEPIFVRHERRNGAGRN
jgi:hypothetical protein